MNKKYVFRTEKLIKSLEEARERAKAQGVTNFVEFADDALEETKTTKGWWTECEGKEVVKNPNDIREDGYMIDNGKRIYLIHLGWCEEVQDETIR